MSKVILVTGGSAGIGKAVATYLSSKGHVVYGTSRSASEGMTEQGFRIVRMDVTDEATVQHALNLILDKEGRLDVLINNAGLGMAGPLESTSDAEAKEIFDTNVFGVLNTCRVATPALRMSKGNIINITSIGGMFGLPYRGIYCSSKSAVEGISEVLSMELWQFGINVSIIEPGDFKTKINDNRKVASNIDKAVYTNFDQALDQINREVAGAKDPILVAKTVERILKSKRPKLRYRVATPVQRLSVFLHKSLGGRTFEKLIAGHYGLRGPKS
ncbi:SDR family oxidoreductase [Sanyastnella coralliicola]|uniref:SDR family oxidoreductase n=1 Tax=Sanyastnella coralliicola TaxID=3069118 RepID=UPI0027B9D347|nr:SDR family oxidoreductase [Longitalea sp. SCSIO 12813]